MSFPQGSGFDEKKGWDFVEGDWSVRTEPLGLWCPIHGYFDCPECSPVGQQLHVPLISAPPVELQSLPIAFAPPPLRKQVEHILAPVPKDMLSTLLMDERWAAAARRGREIHERALLLAKRYQVNYDVALQRALKGE